MLAHPSADVVLRPPGHEAFGEPLATLPREVFFLEALAEPAITVVGQPQVAAQVLACQPQCFFAVVGRGYGLLHGEQGTFAEDPTGLPRVLRGHEVRVGTVGVVPG